MVQADITETVKQQVMAVEPVLLNFFLKLLHNYGAGGHHRDGEAAGAGRTAALPF